MSDVIQSNKYRIQAPIKRRAREALKTSAHSGEKRKEKKKKKKKGRIVTIILTYRHGLVDAANKNLTVITSASIWFTQLDPFMNYQFHSGVRCFADKLSHFIGIH